MNNEQNKEFDINEQDQTEAPEKDPTLTMPVPEIGGTTGPEPTRYGDWEKKGRCIDF